MGMKKINRWFKSLIHGYDLPQLKNRSRGQLCRATRYAFWHRMR